MRTIWQGLNALYLQKHNIYLYCLHWPFVSFFELLQQDFQRLW